MGFTVGIDLGTTNSVVAIKKVGVVTILNAEGEELTPSCVTALPRGDNIDFIVGSRSLNLSKQYPEQTVKSVKRLIGREYLDPEVQHIINHNVVGYKIVSDPKEPNTILIELLGKLYSPETISSFILNKLIEDSKLKLNGEISQAVVTVPAYFSDKQKFATRAACEKAQLKLLRLLSEPTAAALSFGLENTNNYDLKTIMVFDLGGGTFDISVLSLAGGNFMEITKGGDMWLGGDNIDQMLIEYVFEQVEKTLDGVKIYDLIDKMPSSARVVFLIELKEKAEKLKIALSTFKVATIEMFGVLRDEHGKLIDIEVTITRDEFNTIINPVIEKIVTISKNILKEIHFEPELIDLVLMVGGSSLILAIQDELKNLFGESKVMVHPRPMLAVAEGASIMAASISQQDLSIDLVKHVTAHDYYLQLAQGKRHLLVPRNTLLPVKVTEKLKFVNNNQLIARLRVLNAIDHVLEPVGEIWLHKPFKNLDLEGSQDIEELNLEFMVDEDNIITMKVGFLHDQKSKVEGQIVRGGLTCKLYNDLENTLSTLISKSKNGSMEIDLLYLSNIIGANILKVCEPISGKVNLLAKEQVEIQINLLTLLYQNNIMPFHLYDFSKHALEIANKYNILSFKESEILKYFTKELRLALNEFNDFYKLKKIYHEIDEFIKSIPVLLDLIIAEKGAKIIVNEEPFKAKQILEEAKNLSKYYNEGDDDLVENSKMKIYKEVHSRIEWRDDPTKRFDRDVTL